MKKNKNLEISFPTRKLSEWIKNSYFTIFIMFTLILTIALILWFNSIVASSLETQESVVTITDRGDGDQPQQNTPSSQQQEQTPTSTVDHLRQMEKSEQVNIAPSINTQERINPFSE